MATRKTRTAPIKEKSAFVPLPPLQRKYSLERSLLKLDKQAVRGLRFRKRAMPYDDRTGTFYGGELEMITHRNYERALANLWKAEVAAPSLGLRDASREEKKRAEVDQYPDQAETREMIEAIRSDDFQEKIESAFTPRQREALAKILSIILHGEAYAMFTSSSLIPHVKGTGPKLGMAMQVMEEAKHFIVMREVVKRIDKIYPHHAGDYLALENVLRARPMDRLFGMNIVIESIAMTFFSTFSNYPGLDMVLPLFHKDESRHSAFPKWYTQEVPLSFWQKNSPIKRSRRLILLLPLFGLIPVLKEEGDALGIDVFEFGGKMIDKITRLSDITGFRLPLSRSGMMRQYNLIFNLYMRLSDSENYQGFLDYSQHHTYRIRKDLQEVEDEIYGVEGRVTDGLIESIAEKFYRRAARLIDPTVDFDADAA